MTTSIMETGEPMIAGVDSDGRIHRELPALDEVAFDPTQATLDLNKEEKRRTTALLLAIQAYNNLIIKDADYLIAASREAHTNPEMKIRPATMNAMVEAAMDFDDFISGRLHKRIEESAPEV